MLISGSTVAVSKKTRAHKPPWVIICCGKAEQTLPLLTVKCSMLPGYSLSVSESIPLSIMAVFMTGSSSAPFKYETYKEQNDQQQTKNQQCVQ